MPASRFLYLWFALFIFSHWPIYCNGGPGDTLPPQPGTAALYFCDSIFSEAKHSAFTDLARLKDKWYCVFREGEAHFSKDGQIAVISSIKGDTWHKVLQLAHPKYDLRDPKFGKGPDGRLYLLYGAYPKDSLHADSLCGSFITSTRNGKHWRRPRMTDLQGEWAWGITWQGQKAYTVTYRRGRGAMLYESKNGRKWKQLSLLPLSGHANETALLPKGDTALLALVREDADEKKAYTGTTALPYKQWRLQEMWYFMGGPSLVMLPDGQVWAGGRVHRAGNGFAILSTLLPDGQFDFKVNLPSGGDCGYPGMVWHDGMLWVSYYSSHEGKTRIYLAKVLITLDPKIKQKD